jgi:hypothetical protein
VTGQFTKHSFYKQQWKSMFLKRAVATEAVSLNNCQRRASKISFSAAKNA